MVAGNNKSKGGGGGHQPHHQHDRDEPAALTPKTLLARLAHRLEGWFGRRAHWAFCVSVGECFLFLLFYLLKN
jgi:hypothetical protein